MDTSGGKEQLSVCVRVREDETILNLALTAAGQRDDISLRKAEFGILWVLG